MSLNLWHDISWAGDLLWKNKSMMQQHLWRMNLFISALILHTICLIAIPIEVAVHIAHFSGLGRLQQAGRQKGSQKGAGQGPFLKTLWIITLLPSVLEQKWKSKVLMNNYFLRAWGLPMLWRTNGRNALGSLRRNLQCSLSILQSAVVACMTLKLEVSGHGAGRGRQGRFCFEASWAHTWHFVGTSTSHLST